MAGAKKFSAEALLAAPRIGAAVPNYDGTLALYKVSTHSYEEGKTTKEVRVFNLEKGTSEQISADEKGQEAAWIPGSNVVIYLKSESKSDSKSDSKSEDSEEKEKEKGVTRVFAASADDLTKEHYLVAKIDAPVSTMKLKGLADGSVAFVVSGLMAEDGSLYNEEADEIKTTGRIFDSKNVLYWNVFYKARKYALWYNRLVAENGRWKLYGELHAFIKDLPIEAPAGMYGTSDGSSNFDISRKGIAFVGRNLATKAPESDISSIPFFMPIHDFGAAPTKKPIRIPIPDSLGPGASGDIRVSPDKKTVAFLHEEKRDPHNERLFIATLKNDGTIEEAKIVTEAQEDGFDSPSGFEFAGSSDSIIINRQQHGKTALALVQLHSGNKPQVFYHGPGVKGVYARKDGDFSSLLVSSSSFVESITWQTINTADGQVLKTHSSIADNIPDFGLSRDMIKEFWYEGDEGVKIHCFVTVPPGFDEKVKYPWILMPHGGPESAWRDAWSTRWNHAFFAAQGFVVVGPQIAGSTGYGIEFLRRVHNSWAGAPFQDLVHLVKHLETVPYLDQDKAVVSGASYGAFLISWIMGDDMIKRFKGAVWHSGRFVLPVSQMHADVPKRDTAFGGPPYFWENEENIEKWNPGSATRVRRWTNAPPTLVIHSQKDFRCQWTDGLAIYKALQRIGIRSRFLTFPDEGHWILKPDNAKLWLETIVGWMKGCVEGEIVNDNADAADASAAAESRL